MMLAVGKAVLGFFSGLPRWVYIVLGVLAIVAFGVHWHRSAVKAAYSSGYAKGSADTAARFNAAQAKADAAQRAKIAKTVIKQTDISQESTHALDHSYASIDARAHTIGVRHDAAARKRSSEPSAVPATGDASAGARCTAPPDGLPWGVALPLMTEAAKNLAQLNAILDWEAKQDALAKQEQTP